MKELNDAFWRAVAYCLHPRVIGLSFLPLLIGLGLAIGLGWLYWESAVAAVRGTLESWAMVDAALKWVEAMAGPGFRSVLAPMIVVALAVPAVVVLSVLLVALLMVPAIVDLVAARRFPGLERLRGAGIVASVAWSLLCTVLALLALVVTLPLWFIPPLVLVLPPLIWGWLTYRVMIYDVLAEHATREERTEIIRRHGLWLLAIGVLTGYLGAAPGMVWAVGAMAIVFAPLLVPLAIWIYTFVFVFSALWFAHFCLAALAALRAESSPWVTALALPDDTSHENRPPV